jgi:hypothetical protein
VNKKKLLTDPLFILEKFHPLALFVACGLLILMIEKNFAEISLTEKLVFTAIAGPLYFIDIAFESWRIAMLHTSKTTQKIDS